MKTWIDEVIKATEDNEAPQRYFWWAAATCIAAVMGKRVYIDRHFYKLYPNIFVILVSAKSGLRKGVPISMAKTLIEEVGNTRVLAGRMSIEGAIHEFSIQKTLESGEVLNRAQGVLLSDEFAAYMVDSDHALTILTALHNTHEHEKEWRNILKSSPNEVLKEPCISMCAASNERLFEEVVKGKDMEGGFIARSFIVYESKRNTINSLMRKPENIIPWKQLAEYLKLLKNVKGQFIIEEEAIQYYDAWYHKLAKMDYEDRTGTMERLGDQVLKLAMILSLSRDNSLKIDEEIMDLAIDKTQECVVSGTKQISIGNGQSEIAPAVAKVLKALLKEPNHELTRQKLLKKLWPDIDSYLLDRVIETLLGSKAVETERVLKDIVYRMPDTVVREYTRFQEGGK